MNRGTGRLLTGVIAVAAALAMAAPAAAAEHRYPLANWLLESFPGISHEAALADQQATEADSTLTTMDTQWVANAHLVGGEALGFNGISSVAASPGPVVDTTGSFSVAAWVRPSDLSKDRDFVGQDLSTSFTSGRWGGFSVGLRHQGRAAHWTFQMGNGSSRRTAVVAATDPRTLTAADLGRWTHVAASYDAAAHQMTLFVNGAAVATVARTATPWAATGRFTFGRSDDGGPAHFWKGEIIRGLAYDRVLTTADLFGGDIGGFTEAGLLSPWAATEWNFGSAAACFLPEVPDTCNAPSGGPFSYMMQLSFGTGVVYDTYAALSFDDQTSAFDADGNPLFNEDGTQMTVPSVDEHAYLDQKVIHTNDAFSVAAAFRLNDPSRTGPQTIVSLGAASAQPVFSMVYADGAYHVSLAKATGGVAVLSIPATDVQTWHDLIAVYDPHQGSLRLFQDGVLAGSVTVTGAAETGTRMDVGRSTAGDGYLFGDIAALKFWQGTLTDFDIANYTY